MSATTKVSFTPTISFSTPGDLAVVYSAQEGTYWSDGNFVVARFRVAFTPTYTTAGGELVVNGLGQLPDTGPFSNLQGTALGTQPHGVPSDPALSFIDSTGVIRIGAAAGFWDVSTFFSGQAAVVEGQIAFPL